MISSKISGVLFSVNPMTSADEIIVEAAEGYCDQIVSGKVTPEKITIQKKEENHSKSEVVPLELCKLLKETALKIESYFKYPVDVEWTWDGEKLWILQARPITKKGEIFESQGGNGRKDLYSNKNSKEVMGHAVTMMTWSAFNTIINKALKRRYKQKGIKYSKVRKKF
jgi:phosphoenolpyruvate synthase/pyruvate phosphate dikinase